MGFTEELEKSLSHARTIFLQMQDETSKGRLSELEVDASHSCDIQNEIDETVLKIQQLSRRLKADEGMKQQLMKDVDEKKKESEKLEADLKAKKEEIAKEKQKQVDLEFRKLQASAGFSAKDAFLREKVVNSISAYVASTGLSFSTPHEGYAVNYGTKKAKFFQVQGLPIKSATETIWNTITSTQNISKPNPSDGM